MDTNEKQELLTRAEKVFFTALLAGYCNENGSSPEKENPHVAKETSPLGEILYHFHEDDFYVRDCWINNSPSRHSLGCTYIFYQELPIWAMSYGGWYPEAVTPFLKEALRKNYRDKLFLGGRGPSLYSGKVAHGTYQYRNDCERYSSFNKFCGEEKIWHYYLKPDETTGHKLMGWHTYFGHTMI